MEKISGVILLGWIASHLKTTSQGCLKTRTEEMRPVQVHQFLGLNDLSWETAGASFDILIFDLKILCRTYI